MNKTTRQTMHSSNRMDWETPNSLFQQLNKEFRFAIDAAAIKENTKCETYLCPEFDALNHAWPSQGAIWLNPPYGRDIGRWMRKAYDEAQQRDYPVVCLIPSRTDTAYWHDYVMKAAEIRFIRGRVTFVGAESAAPFPSAIVVFRRTKKQTPSIGAFVQNK